jgi:hypothetical protein
MNNDVAQALKKLKIRLEKATVRQRVDSVKKRVVAYAEIGIDDFAAILSDLQDCITKLEHSNDE